MAEGVVQKRGSMLVFGAPAIEEDEIQEVVASLRSGWLGTGPKVARFEQAFGAYKGSPYPVALNSCTAALHLSLLAMGLEPGDEVITTPLTFCATVNAIIHAGGTPVLCDVDASTMNIDPDRVEEKITRRTRALLPVHFAGRPCDMDSLVALAERHGIAIVEDCAHAIETEYKGQKAGTIGDFGCFSFYVTKNVATGEGGMVLARREQDAARIKVLALHGMTKDAWKRFGDAGYRHYQVIEAGYKYNMMDLQAAIGLHQLARIEENWVRRERLWRLYMEALGDLPLELPQPVSADMRHSYHLFTVLVEESRCGVDRDLFLQRMTDQNIGVGVHYLAIPDHPYYHDTYGWRPEDYPVATRIGRTTASLPLSAALTEEDALNVIDATRWAASP